MVPVKGEMRASKALFSPHPDNLRRHCLLGLGALLCRSFFRVGSKFLLFVLSSS